MKHHCTFKLALKRGKKNKKIKIKEETVASVRHRYCLLSSTQIVSLDSPNPKWAKDGGNTQEKDVSVCSEDQSFGKEAHFSGLFSVCVHTCK